MSLPPELPPSELVLWLPMPYNRNRGWSHRAQETKLKKAYWAELNQRMDSGYYIPRPPSTPPVRAKVLALFHVRDAGRRMDRDNLYSRFKRIGDWLVAHGYLAGDREDQCELVCAQVVGKDAVPELCSVKVTITRVEET